MRSVGEGCRYIIVENPRLEAGIGIEEDMVCPVARAKRTVIDGTDIRVVDSVRRSGHMEATYRHGKAARRLCHQLEPDHGAITCAARGCDRHSLGSVANAEVFLGKAIGKEQ